MNRIRRLGSGLRVRWWIDSDCFVERDFDGRFDWRRLDCVLEGMGRGVWAGWFGRLSFGRSGLERWNDEGVADPSYIH